MPVEKAGNALNFRRGTLLSGRVRKVWGRRSVVHFVVILFDLFVASWNLVVHIDFSLLTVASEMNWFLSVHIGMLGVDVMML